MFEGAYSVSTLLFSQCLESLFLRAVESTYRLLNSVASLPTSQCTHACPTLFTFLHEFKHVLTSPCFTSNLPNSMLVDSLCHVEHT